VIPLFPPRPLPFRANSEMAPVIAEETLEHPRSRVAPYAFAGVAALAMVATLPGRTHGLGLFTESILADFKIERVPYAALNLWATLFGSLFCIPIGWMLDRYGIRAMMSSVTLALGIVVVGIGLLDGGGIEAPLPSIDLYEGRVETVRVPALLFTLILLTRGLGQSALSVVSLAVLGKAAGRTPGPVVGVYSVLVSLGFMAAFGALKVAFDFWQLGWRTNWSAIGGILIAIGIAVALLVRNPRDGTAARSKNSGNPTSGELIAEAELALDGVPSLSESAGTGLLAALMTPAFWVFALAVSLYGLVSAGVSLFGQSMLKERGFDSEVFRTITILGPLVGLAANLATGFLARRFSMGRLLAVAMSILAAALLAFPRVSSLAEVYVYAVTMGVAGGMVTVLFFAVWGPAFGPKHLGKIQGAAQLLTVLASALGPLLLALSQRATGSYTLVFQQLAVAALIFAVAAWVVPIPKFVPRTEEAT
jgi:MFS family permease